MKTITIKDVKKWEAKTKKNYDMLEKKIIRDKGIREFLTVKKL